MYDAIVVGARCAGAPTAMLLARKGHKVLLVDRATFPSNIPHGHFIQHSGPPACTAGVCSIGSSPPGARRSRRSARTSAISRWSAST
jgi:glycine/D-amino acid oxidase-like deaminating enzyme